MADPNFEEPSFQEQQLRGREVMAQQEQAIAAAKAEEAQKKEAVERAAQEEAMALQFQEQMVIDRQQAVLASAPPADAPLPQGRGLPTAEIDKKIANLEKQTSNEYWMAYMMLTTGAAVVDILQAISDLSVILALLASGLGVGFSVVRHYGLKYANPNASNDERNMMLRRTLISGAISLVPFIDLLPEQTMFMVREFTVKKESIAAAEGELRKLRAERAKMLKPLLN